jgi:transposase
MWLARLTEMRLLRASSVPPKAIRGLRDYTRARTRLIQERTRCWQRLEKLLKGALVPDPAEQRRHRPVPQQVQACILNAPPKGEELHHTAVVFDAT